MSAIFEITSQIWCTIEGGASLDNATTVWLFDAKWFSKEQQHAAKCKMHAGARTPTYAVCGASEMQGQRLESLVSKIYIILHRHHFSTDALVGVLWNFLSTMHGGIGGDLYICFVVHGFVIHVPYSLDHFCCRHLHVPLCKGRVEVCAWNPS